MSKLFTLTQAALLRQGLGLQIKPIPQVVPVYTGPQIHLPFVASYHDVIRFSVLNFLDLSQISQIRPKIATVESSLIIILDHTSLKQPLCKEGDAGVFCKWFE